MDFNVKRYRNEDGCVNLGAWRKLDSSTKICLPTDKKLYVPRSELSPDWKYRLSREGISPQVTADPEIYLLDRSREVIDAAIDAKIKPEDYLGKVVKRVKNKFMTCEVSPELSEFEKKVSFWYKGHGRLRDARNREEIFEYGDLYFFAVPGASDLPLILGDDRETGKEVWGIANRDPESVFNPFSKLHYNLYFPFVERNADSDQRHPATSFDMIVDGFNLMTKRLESFLS